ncbi:DUF7573 domain-containing protein [Halopiger goleimassiliensis]|uniref:DUF7573 domain-containing protein n=1 Tax=Halopiger goleimassiliensis TaxID=1293048 RepID=UPI0006781886|nr:zinc ribbon domain-containing protein [Halopiger goleimassiliensis]
MTEDATLTEFLESASAESADAADEGDGTDEDGTEAGVDGDTDGAESAAATANLEGETANADDALETDGTKTETDAKSGADGTFEDDVDAGFEDDADAGEPTRTYAWGEYDCERCGESTERAWTDDGAVVCPTCKEW